MDEFDTLPAALRRRAFLVPAARALAVPYARLRADDLDAPTRSLRVPPSVDTSTVAGRAHAWAPLLAHDQFFSHTTAAALWGMPLPARFDQRGPLHVTTLDASPGPSDPSDPSGACGPTVMRRTGVVGHRADARHVRALHRGRLLLSDPVQVFLECATLVGPRGTMRLDDLVAMGDYLVRSGRVVPLDRLRAIVSRIRARRGVRTMRAAVDLVRDGADSSMETRMRLVLGRGGSPEPELNPHIHDRSGRFIGRPDLFFREARLALEYEGDHHRTDRWTFRNDIRRREVFEDSGIRQFRVTADDLGVHREAFVGRVLALLAERTPR